VDAICFELAWVDKGVVSFIIRRLGLSRYLDAPGNSHGIIISYIAYLNPFVANK
jgi:hypothetical protein